MKKFIIYILTLSIFCSFLPCSAAVYSDVESSKAIEVITGIGIMEGYSDGTFLPDNNITRAEFAKVIAGIYSYGNENDGTAEWKNTYFTDIYSGTELIPLEEMQKEEAGVFDDVPASSWAYDSIKLVSELGIMVGDGSGSFGADDNLTLEQALKVIVTMLGYSSMAKLRGGYPSGFTSIATELNLTDSVKTSMKDYATRKDVAQIIYNALDIEVMQNVFEDGDWVQKKIEDETFLLKLFGLYSGRGRMTDNGFTSLTSVNGINAGRVVINGQVYQTGENSDLFKHFIGRDIEYYYSAQDSDNVLVFAMLSGRDTVCEIDIRDFIDYKDNKLNYFQNTREKSISVIKAPYFVYNGGAMSEVENDIFDFNYGKITAVSSAGSSEADLIIIDSYKNFNIDYVDTLAKKIYSSSSVMGKEISVDEDEKDIVIYNPQNEIISLDEIVGGSVASVSEGEGIIKIYISDEVVSDFKVASVGINENDETVVVSDEGQRIVISKDYTDVNSDNLPKIGSTYQFYLDILGNIVKFYKQSSEYEAAFMSDVRLIGDEGFEDGIRIKYYDMNARQLVTGYCADKVKVIHTDDKISTYSLSSEIFSLYGVLSSYTYSIVNDVSEKTGGMFRYKLNNDGEIIEIELAGQFENSNDDSSRLVEIKLANSSKNLNFYNGKGLIGGNIIINDNTQILQCNFRSENFAENKGYNLISRAFYTENDKFDKQETKFYSTVRNSPIAEYMIETTDSSQSISARDHTLGIITDMYKGVNDDNEAVTFICLDTKEYAASDEVLEPGKVTNMQGDSSYKSADGQTHYFEVEEGDIIKYSLSGDGEIGAIQLVYDADSDYSEGIMIGETVYNGWSERGNLAGCIDGYNKNIAKYSNPFSVDNGFEFAADSYSWSYYNNYARVKLGSILRCGNGYVITTARNMAENPGDVSYEGDGVYATNTYSVASATLVTVSDRYVNVSSVPVQSLRSYEIAGEACDRVLITSRLGAVRNMIVYRYEN